MSGHHHHDDDDHTEPPSDLVLRVKALESLLIEKGLVEPAAIDELIDVYETKVGPRNGARVVARAWTDPAFKKWLIEDASAAIASLGYTGRQGEHMRVVENTPRRPQPGRLYPVFLLSMAGAGAAAGLVQIGAVPRPRRGRPARCFERIRHGTVRGRRNPRLGFNLGNAVSRAAGTSPRRPGT